MHIIQDKMRTRRPLPSCRLYLKYLVGSEHDMPACRHVTGTAWQHCWTRHPTVASHNVVLGSGTGAVLGGHTRPRKARESLLSSHVTHAPPIPTLQQNWNIDGSRRRGKAKPRKIGGRCHLNKMNVHGVTSDVVSIW
jgi:hypothetical protein